MRIDYKILWVDDDKDWVESQLDDVAEYLAKSGFDLVPEIKPSYKNIDFSQYDIISVDCNLGDDEKGIDALNIIRQQDQIYTEILFYSQAGVQSLRSEIQKQEYVEGVYFASRENFKEKLEALIDTTIRKTQEINNLRGLVMAETSTLDKLIKVILLKKEWTEEHFASHNKKRSEHHDEKKRELEKLSSFDIKNLTQLLFGYSDSHFCFNTLKGFISEESWNNIKDYLEIIQIRNILAHSKEISSTAEKITLEKTKSDGSTESITFTPNDFIELRKKIKNFRDKFEEIFSAD